MYKGLLDAGRIALPPSFILGAATAAYQIEGGATEGGRGPSIWDTFSHTPGKTEGGATGDIAADHYHRVDEDLGLMDSLNLDAYRFSVSWSRIMPTGEGKVNAEGLNFYSRLVDDLLARGIQPIVTLNHWDLPQALEDKYGGWRGRETASPSRSTQRSWAGRSATGSISGQPTTNPGTTPSPATAAGLSLQAEQATRTRSSRHITSTFPMD
jgi:beta-glucosidase